MTPRLLARPALALLGATLLALLLAAPALASFPEQFGPESFGLYSFGAAASGDDAGAQPATQAGSHPFQLSVDLEFDHQLTAEEESLAQKVHSGEFADETRIYADPRDVLANLPPGLLGNPRATPELCTETELVGTLAGHTCPPASAVGYLDVRLGAGTLINPLHTPVYNMVAPPGLPAQLGFDVAGFGLVGHIAPRLRAGGDYGIAGAVSGIPQGRVLFGARLILWGDPSNPAHDAWRGECAAHHNVREVLVEHHTATSCPVERTTTPFLTLPTACSGAPLPLTASADSWQQPGDTVEAPLAALEPLSGCASLPFEPELEARPTTNVADSPTGLDFNLKIPQPQEPEGDAEAHLKTAVVTLPAGLAINPSVADGLAACSPAQIGLQPPASERQAIVLDRPAAHAFVLRLEGHQTASLPAEATPAEVQEALEALPQIGPGNVEVSGSPGGWEVQLTGALAGAQLPPLGAEVAQSASQSVAVTASGGAFGLSLAGHSTTATATSPGFLKGATQIPIENVSGTFLPDQLLEGTGIKPDTSVLAATPTQLTLSAPTTEAKTAVSLAAALRFNTNAAHVQRALEALPAIGPGNVQVTGGPLSGLSQDLRPYTVTFTGALAEAEPETMSATSALTGPLAGVQVSSQPLSTKPLRAAIAQPAGAIRFSPEAPSCPNASKIGSVEVTTPLLEEPLPGAVYLAAQHDNPFHSLMAIYIVINDPERGILVKLPGHVEPDPQTGQLTTTVEESPQLPFEEFHLHFFKGDRAPLRTPPTCGKYETTTELTPYSHVEVNEAGEEFEATPIAKPADPYEITQAPGGGNCPTSASQEPNAPHFSAGTTNPTAGAYSPFVLKLSRQDGSQELHGLNVTLPPGLTGKLAGVGECSEAQIAAAKAREREGQGAAERESPSCPASTEVGTVDVAAGAGPSPFHVAGHAYLAGPYRGAPLSMVIVTPAVAGPFDLGTVVVRAGLYVNPETAQITVKSDPIPTILDGIPLDVRSIAVDVSRNRFTLNPTNCEAHSIDATALTVLEQSAALTEPFQVGGCRALAFKPHLAISLKGATRRAGHPALRAVLTYPKRGAYANIARAQVTLPHSEFLDQAHIGTVCTKVQFAEGSTPGEKCPAASIYGFARATTPLLDKPLEGPVYLRSSTHKLPDLVAALNGQIQIALAGTIDSVHGGIRNRFEVVPDAPVSKFTLSMQGGKKGLLQNSTNLCTRKNHAISEFTGQNGKIYDTKPVLKAKCPKAKKGRKKGKRKH
jgi:hypothetical protein